MDANEAMASDADELIVAAGSLLVLVGVSGSGKSTWAAEHFRPDHVVSSDALRALVGLGEHDQRAGTDAFAVLDLVVDRRLARGLTTVIDALGLDARQRSGWIDTARRHGRSAIAVAFDTPAAECRRRNKARPHPVPAKALTSQLRRWPDVLAALPDEFDRVEPPTSAVRIVPNALVAHRHLTRVQEDDPVPLTFGLTISSYDWPGGTDDIAAGLATIAREAEEAGFSSLWVMDHVMQIPQVGRAWDPMLESTTTLGFLAAATRQIRLGTLVTGITYRNVAHVGKIAATLDVLSGGRAMCGLGAAWFDREHRAYGWAMPSLAERYELLEDALELFPLLWGPGTPEYSGRRVHVAEAICYPRPVQDRIPILVGGSGERMTLQLVARHADACNLFGEPDVVRHKREVLRQHCRVEERDPDEITVTQLSSVLCAADAAALNAALGDVTGGRLPAEIAATELTAGTVADHIGRFRALADAGVDEVIVSLADVGRPGAVERFTPVIDAFG